MFLGWFRFSGDGPGLTMSLQEEREGIKNIGKFHKVFLKYLVHTCEKKKKQGLECLCGKDSKSEKHKERKITFI